MEIAFGVWSWTGFIVETKWKSEKKKFKKRTHNGVHYTKVNDPLNELDILKTTLKPLK